MKSLLFYSGGKDSIALLHLMREQLDDCLVVWINTGDPLPEVREHMDSVKSRVPMFREVVSDVHADIEQNGYPADLSPVSSGRAEKSKARPWDQCCNNNIWWPTQQLLNECRGEYSTIIRGQKGSDRLRASTYSGQHIDGFDILYPLEGWSDDDVFAYIEENGLDLPAHYKSFKSSIDCWACTAHTQDNRGKLAYLRAHHPEKGHELARRMTAIIHEAERELHYMHRFTEV